MNGLALSGPDGAVDLLQQMLEIPSLSGQETAVARFLVQQMNQSGFSADVDKAGNAVGQRSCPDKDGQIDREVVLLGHMDTVPGDIPVRLANGRLAGRGAVDAKGPLAAFIVAAARTALPPGTRLIVVGAVEEESATSKGARFFAGQYRPDFCIIGEPSGWNGITLGYKGRLLIDYGRSQPMAHTAGPGSSAAEAGIAWYNQVEDFVQRFNQDKPRLFDQLLLSIRDIHTSSSGLENRVEMKLGLRLPPGFETEEFVHWLQEKAGSEATVHPYGHEAAIQSKRTNPLARLFNQAIRQAGSPPTYKLKTGTCDMNVVGPVWQCPIVAYGPGDSTLDHTPDEHIIIEEYLQAIEILQTVLTNID